MKKSNILLSLLIAFSFVAVSFGQDEGLSRTTPVISHTGSGTPNNNEQIKWNIIFINQNKIILKLTKSIECATLTSISAICEGENLTVHYNENDIKNLKTGIEKLVTVRFDGNVLNKKVSVGLNWDLSRCDDSIMKDNNMQQSSVSKNQNKLKAMAPQGKQTLVLVNPKLTYSPSDFLYLHFKDKNIIPVESQN